MNPLAKVLSIGARGAAKHRPAVGVDGAVSTMSRKEILNLIRNGSQRNSEYIGGYAGGRSNSAAHAMDIGVMPRSHWTKRGLPDIAAEELGVEPAAVAAAIKPRRLDELLELESWHHTGGKGYFNQTDFYRPDSAKIAGEVFPDIKKYSDRIDAQIDSPEARALASIRRRQQRPAKAQVGIKGLHEYLRMVEERGRGYAEVPYMSMGEAWASLPAVKDLVAPERQRMLEDIARKRFTSQYNKTRSEMKKTQAVLESQYPIKLPSNNYFGYQRVNVDNSYGYKPTGRGGQVMLDVYDGTSTPRRGYVNLRELPEDVANRFRGQYNG